MEGERLFDQADNLSNIKIPGTNLEVIPDGYPSLTDGKTKSVWLKNPHGSCACWICQAYGLQLGQKKYIVGKNGAKKRNPIFKAKDRRSLRCGFGNCHTRNRSFDNLVKYALNKDFKKWRMQKNLYGKLKDNRFKEFQFKFDKAFGVKPYVPLPSGGKHKKYFQVTIHVFSGAENYF